MTTEFILEGIEDVEDLPWENKDEGSSSMSLERYNHLYHLMHQGNNAFRDTKFDQAIEYFSRANNIEPGDPIILSNRCSSYLRLSQFLKQRPPSASEYRPLSGLDPTTHAGLALKDAEKVMSLRSNSVTSYILKANALILLEKYEQAWDVISSGLEIDPQSNHLLNLQNSIANTFIRRSHVKPQRTDDYDCTLCLKLLYQPVTTPCGHSFCRSCLFQSMDRGNRCPLCRTVLLISPRTCSISVTLNNIIQKNFPEEYEERKSEHASLTNPAVDLLPLFVMDVILPCQKFQLNIFEPRYRLMLFNMISKLGIPRTRVVCQPTICEGSSCLALAKYLPTRLNDLDSCTYAVMYLVDDECKSNEEVRRIMEGNRRMGMVIIDSSTSSIADYACEVEITDCEPLPDGRFFLEVESRRRCRIIRNWDQDGYRIAEVEWVHDSYPPEGSNERNDLLEMTYKAAGFAQQWIREARDGAQGDRIRLAELFKAEGLMPPTNDPERFSFWLTTLTNRRPSERLDLLRIRDTMERIRRGLIYMKAEEQGCRLQ